MKVMCRRLNFVAESLTQTTTYTSIPISQYVATPEMHTDPVYSRLHFRRKLEEMGAPDRITNRLLKGLGETFTFGQLESHK